MEHVNAVINPGEGKRERERERERVEGREGRDKYHISGNFASLYFHEFCEFCSVAKLNFAKVLPCLLSCHVDHLQKYFP